MRVRGKILLSLAMLLPMLFALAPPIVLAVPTTVSVVFRDTLTNEMIDVKNVGEQFTIDIMIANSPPIVQWMVRIQWNEDIVSLVGNPKEGTFLKNVGTTSFLFKPATPGKLPEITGILLDPVTASGDGDLCNITFVVDQAGETNIEIYDSDILNGGSQPHDRVNGHFLLHPPPPTAPTASFTPPHCTQFRLEEGKVTVTFNATTSKAGWDVLPVGHSCPIVEYRWEIADLATEIIVEPMFVDPAGASETFDVVISIVDSPAITAWVLTNIRWNPAVLEFTGADEGDFLSKHGVTAFMSKPPKPGLIPEMTCALFELCKTQNGDGVLVTLHFHSIAAGHSDITIDGYDYQSCGGKWWIADSLGHWDAVSWKKTQIWAFTEMGDVPVTLEVYAPDPTPPTDERYVDTASVTQTIHIMPARVGPAIDVYTQRGGEGDGYDPVTGLPFPSPSGWSRAFGPQEEVILYALVTYGQEPVEYKPVAFEVKDPTDNTQVYRTAFTNAMGIATSSFRIPWTGAAAESLFGDWSIYGTVDIAGTTAKDICKFKFGYIVSIGTIIVTGSPLKKGMSLTVKADLQSIDFVSKDVYLTIVAHDECNVPIGLAADWITVAAEDGLSPEWTITIPSWAFVGVGAVYGNVYTKSPALGGTPMCPEKDASFIILRT